MKQDFLLNNLKAKKLYNTYAKDLPIIDFHNHINVSNLKNDHQFSNLTEVWIACDPYKHRLMRICGVDEFYITGDATDFEKFNAYCSIFSLLAGNPVYDWSRMELKFLFDIDLEINEDNAQKIYDLANEKLATPEFTHNAILKKFNVAYQSPVVGLLDDLSAFDGITVAPSLRGDNLLMPNADLEKELMEKSGITITDTDSYVKAIAVLLDDFDKAGCKFADHALDANFFTSNGVEKKVEILTKLGVEYAKRGWTLLLHMDAKRETSQRLRQLAGPAGGYAGVGGNFDISSVIDLLGNMEKQGGLPDTVLFPLNMSDQAPLAVAQGSFSQDGVASKVQLGPAWWWCDHALGITNTLSCIANFGVVSQFIGMTTDSRSVLSFMRHDYFRRILCSWLVEQNDAKGWDLSLEQLGVIVKKISYENALDKIRK